MKGDSERKDNGKSDSKSQYESTSDICREARAIS
jgi:hypothetical protein